MGVGVGGCGTNWESSVDVDTHRVCTSYLVEAAVKHRELALCSVMT